MPSKPTFTLTATSRLAKVKVPTTIRLDFSRVPRDADVCEVAKAVAKRVVENEAKASKPKLLVNVKEITAAFRQWKKENPDAVVTNPYGGSADEPDVDQDADDSDD